MDKAIEAAITAHLAQREADGFVMVPVEPTAEQLLHGRRWGANCGGIYRAMIAARPKGDAFTVAT